MTKKYANNVTLRLSAITTTGSLTSVQASAAAVAKKQGKNTKVVSCTPDGRAVKQVYIPKDKTGDTVEVFQKHELEKATEDGEGNLVLVGKDNLDAAKQSPLPKNVLNLTVHEADELDGLNWHSNDHNAYVFQPHDEDEANVAWHNLLRELIARSGKAFCTQAVIQNGGEGFYRLRLWRNNIVVERQAPPEQINEIPEGNEGGIKDSTYDKALAAVQGMVEEFDPAKYADRAHAAVAALNEQATSGEVTVVVEPEKAAEAFDIDAALDGFGL